MTTPDRQMPDNPPPADEAVRRQIAHATLRLRSYRMARDRARLARLKSRPDLAEAVAALLRNPA